MAWEWLALESLIKLWPAGSGLSPVDNGWGPKVGSLRVRYVLFSEETLQQVLERPSDASRRISLLGSVESKAQE